jgi:putative N6-adenine-specific DNA methylase
VRVVDDRVTVSIDTSGEPLYKRGWRHEVGKAPVRETLAAAMLLATGWTGDGPLVDPFCGSGTIAIEAALLARNIAPGHARRFTFQEWPSFEPGTWASVVATAKAGAREAVGAPIVAGDREEGAVRAARANAVRAGVAADIEVVHAPLSTLTMPDAPAGWIVTNPPYGERVKGGADLRDLYASVGHVVRARPDGWRAGMLVADAALAQHSGLTLSARFETRNGPIPVSFLTT